MVASLDCVSDCLVMQRMAPEVLPDVQQSCQDLKEEHIRKMGNLKAHLHQVSNPHF